MGIGEEQMKRLRDLIIEELESGDTIELKNLEIVYVVKNGNLLIQVPDNYNEDNIQMYLDDTCMPNMPSNDKDAKELFGEDNTKNITDAYFSYKNLTLPENSTVKPDLEWDKRYDNKTDKNAKLIVYSLDEFKYTIAFERFLLNNYNNLEVDAILEDLFKSTESNKIHPWAFEIILEEINYE